MKPFAPAALALVLTLTACDRRPTPTEPPQAAPTRPLAFQQADAAAKVALTLPAEISKYPALHAALYDREVAQLKDFAAKAETERETSEGQFPWRQHESQRQWAVTASTPRLVSLRALWFDYTGGAHPNHGAAALLWDATKGAEIKPVALFRPDADMTVLDRAICDAVTMAKSHREGAVPLSDIFTCPKWTETVLVLAPSTEPAKIGGLVALIDPYVVGPYVEGDYEVTIPLPAFQALLAPTYAGAFAGSPKSPGNPDGSVSVTMDVK